MTEQELQDKAKDLAKNVPLRTDTPYPEMVRYFFASMYLRGYDDGKNDTTEWHYPSKGEYPTETDDYLLIVKQESMRVFAIGAYFVGAKEWQYVTCGYEEGCDEPIAWMPLPEPPKEEA